MKTNEAPEKLYIDLFKGEFNVSYFPTNNSVEYVRKDAFIEKACEWLECNNTLPDGEVSDYIENFKKAMML